MDMTAKGLIQRYDRLKAARANWEQQWDEIAYHVVPSKVGFISDKESKGERDTDAIYDSTAIHSSNLLASSIHATLTSPSMRWFGLRFREEELNENQEAKEWLEDAGEKMYAEINESTFDSEVNELYQDLVDFSTSPQLVDMDKDGKLRIQTLPLSDCVISENSDGRVDTMFRRFKWTARQIVDKWGEDVELEKVKGALEHNPDQEFTMLHVVMPREGKDVIYDDLVDAKRRPFAEYYICMEEKTIVEEGGHYEFPFMVPRWAKRAGDVYGYSPTYMAMPDIKTINKAKYLELSAWEGSIAPPMKSMFSDIIGDVNLYPNGITNVRDMNAIQPMMEATNWQATMMKSDEIRQSIRNIYYTDQLVLPDVPNATAYEMSKRYEQMQKLLGSTFGRLVNEYLDPFIQRVFNQMMREGKFDEMPEVLQTGEYDANIDIEYVSPLARAQKMEDVQAIQGFVGFVAGIREVFPQAGDILDIDKALRKVAKRMGTPSDAIRSEEQVNELREKQKAEQEQMMQQAAAMQQGGQPGGQG